MNNKIFISIASYCDPELVNTINDCIKKAQDPSRLVFCIAHQHNKEDKWDTLVDFAGDERFRIIDIDHKDSQGACWARSLIQQQYQGEQYTLQIDSHHRFSRWWDMHLISMLESLQKLGYQKPILTSYLPSYNPNNDPYERVREVWKMDFDRFTPEGIVFMVPSPVEAPEEHKLPIPTRFFSAHFAFTLGLFNREVPYDPHIYFHGEEISMAVRAYTHGYDLFVPNRTVAWHEYTRQNRIRHWDEHEDWAERNAASLLRVKRLLGVDYIQGDPDRDPKYACGSERHISEYERYAGIRFGDRAIQTYTLQNLDPPNPLYSTAIAYEASFVQMFRHCVDVYKDSIGDIKWDGWAVIFEDIEGTEMYREDVLPDEMENLRKETKDDFYHVWRQFNTKQLPHHVIVWPYSFDPEIEWGDKTEILIPTV